ncbi:MAG: nitroreductase family protein [Candidatus Omnitrophica bacterium]|nr:nitroreductase family protein [Candidatus Omnitrophota bacterium]
MDAILKRRSVRRYTDKEVSEDLIKKIIEAGMNAPSAGNQQPWHFLIMKNKKTLEDASGCSPHAHALKDAAAGILLCGDLSLEKHKDYWVQDCSACAENMLLEVAELSLGAVWLGVYPRQDRVDYLKKYFALPEQVIPFAIISIGYPADEIKVTNRYNVTRLHYEKW